MQRKLPVHIALVGMSNIGKSHWARRLEAQGGYERVHCDHLVEQKLSAELHKGGYAGIADVARWMGQPYAPRYAETSRQYLDCEKQAMEEIIARLETKAVRPMVIDTTGSVIHTGADIIAALRRLTRVVYFEASLAHVEQLFQRYIAHPKPVIWEEPMRLAPGEDPQEALKRAYPQLLADRAKRYAQMAHVTVPYERHKNAQADLSLLLGAEIKPA